MKLKSLLEAEGHKGDEEDDDLPTAQLKDLSKMLHAVDLRFRPKNDTDEIEYTKPTGDAICWFSWDDNVADFDMIATDKATAMATAKKLVDEVEKQGCKLVSATYYLRDLNYERRLGNGSHDYRDTGPEKRDITHNLK